MCDLEQLSKILSHYMPGHNYISLEQCTAKYQTTIKLIVLANP